jgi:hypothetical protein
LLLLLGEGRPEAGETTVGAQTGGLRQQPGSDIETLSSVAGQWQQWRKWRQREFEFAETVFVELKQVKSEYGLIHFHSHF